MVDINNHIVQFYKDDEFICDTIINFAINGLKNNNAVVIISKINHITIIEEKLKKNKNIFDIKDKNQLIMLNAEDILSKIIENNLPDIKKFNQIIGKLIQELIIKFNTVYAYGEMVDILWNKNNFQATFLLEKIWNDFIKQNSLILMCGYKISSFKDNTYIKGFHEICCNHTNVIPTEEFIKIENNEEQKRMITMFQCKEQILEFEIENRIKMEKLLTEQRIKTQMAHEFQLQKEEFINIICHEIRNPLNIIYGINTLTNDLISILDEIFKEEQKNLSKINSYKFHDILTKIKENQNIIEKCSQQQKIIVDDVLDLSKLENDKIVLNPVIFCLKDTFNTIVKMYNPQIEEKKLNILLNVDNIFLKADVNRISQIIINIFSNAIKFTPKKGNISITVNKIFLFDNKDEIKLKICFEDTGIGMTDEEINRLFKPFSQANKQISSKYGGSGLGLMICKKLIEIMNGNIHVESQKYIGTKFIFTIFCKIPKKEEIDELYKKEYNEDIKEINNLSLQDEKNITILIVEDNKINQRILINYLNRKGYFYQIANNGIEAIEKYKKFKFDIILMDIEMPIMGGLEATQKIRELEKHKCKKNIPIIGVSANSQKNQIEIAIKSGMTDYLTKPYKKNELYQLIKKQI